MIEVDAAYLQMMYQEHAEHARLHETHRGTATTLMMALIGAVAVFGIGQSTLNWHVAGAGLIISATSLLGAILNYKHHEKAELHKLLLTAYRKEIERMVSVDLSKIQYLQRNVHGKLFPITSTYLK